MALMWHTGQRDDTGSNVRKGGLGEGGERGEGEGGMGGGEGSKSHRHSIQH